MSFANQPARLLISSDDLDSGTGNNFSILLPEPLTGACKVDLIRAVIPNTGYNIPDYQNTFYYYLSTAPNTLLTLTFTSNKQYFAGLPDLCSAISNDATAQGKSITFSVSPSSGTGSGVYRITATYTGGGGAYVIPAPSTAWLTKFALNTRLGFPNDRGQAVINYTGTLLPNLVRSKVVYVLCNVVMNTSISTDGLRTAIAKIPVNSVFGGLTIFNPPLYAWNKLVPSNSYQNIQISLLDDQYQPYPLQKEEFCEFEIAFQYGNGMDKSISE